MGPVGPVKECPRELGGKFISHKMSSILSLEFDLLLLPGIKRMPRWQAVAAIGVLGALLCLVALVQVHIDLSEPSQCQTTYIRQDYKQIQLGSDVAAAYPSYRLIAYTGDGLADPAAGHQGQTVPVLFVHGHLGTHQQMRSLASETGRELARRAQQDSNLSYWLSWQAVDFGEELSALSARLLARQTGFVVTCIKHLLRGHQNSGRTEAPFRLMLVGYSMGGVVARAALRQLERDPEFDVSSVALLVTLGAPNRHFPSFMPPTAFNTVLDPAYGAAAAAAQGAGSHELPGPGSGWALPTLAVTAGPGDMLVLEQLSGAPMGAAAVLASWVQLSMQDVPGVWTSSNHKSIVSCNQLVRQLAPLLVDVAQLSLEAAISAPHGSMAAIIASSGAEGQQGAAGLQKQVLQLLRQRMSTNIARSLAAQGAPLLASSEGRCSGGGSAARQVERQPGVGQHGLRVKEDAAWAFEELLSGQGISLSWGMSHLQTRGAAGVLLLVHQARPCRDFFVRVVAAVQGEAGREAWEAAELAGAAQPLPSLLPGVLQQAGGPGRQRKWQEIWEGIDWLGNATWLLYVPVSALGPGSKLELELTAPSGAGATLVAQVLNHHPLDDPVLLPAPFAGPLTVPAGSAAVKCYQPPLQWLFPGTISSAASPTGPATSCPAEGGAAGIPSWAAQAAAVLLGTAPPLLLRVVSHSGSSPEPGGAASVACHVPGVVGVEADGQGPSPDVVRLGVRAVPLWRGGMAGRSLVLVTDPRCSHTLSVEWDVAAWLGVSLRHHAYALPSLCLALAMMAALGSSCGRRAATLPALAAAAAATAVVVAAWGSQQPQLAKRTSGLAPWVGISIVEGSTLFVLAQAVLLALRASAKLSVRVLACVAGRWGGSRFGGVAVAAAWAVAVLGAATVHPALSLLAGVLRLWLSLSAAGSAPASRCSKRPSSPAAESDQRASGHEQGGALPTAAGSALRRRLGAEAHAPGQQPWLTNTATGQLAADAFSPQQGQQGEGAGGSGSSGSSSERPLHDDWTGQGGGLDWLLLYWLMLVLAAPGLLAWAHTGHRAGIGGGLSLEAVVLVAMGLHASWIAGKVRPGWASRAPTGGAQLEVAYLATGFLAAVVTAVTGLWGYPYVAVYCGSALTALVLFGELWEAVQHSRHRCTYAE